MILRLPGWFVRTVCSVIILLSRAKIKLSTFCMQYFSISLHMWDSPRERRRIGRWVAHFLRPSEEKHPKLLHLGRRLQLVCMQRLNSSYLSFFSRMAWCCQVFAGRNPEGVAATMVDSAVPCFTADHSTAWQFTEGTAAGSLRRQPHSRPLVPFAGLLVATTSLAISDNMTRRFLWRLLLPHRDCFWYTRSFIKFEQNYCKAFVKYAQIRFVRASYTARWTLCGCLISAISRIMNKTSLRNFLNNKSNYRVRIKNMLKII